MPLRCLPRPWLLTLVCVALLFVRLGGAHMHLCFDGGEPPASLHVTDASHHAEHHDGQDHVDRDVSLLGDALTKFGKSSLDQPLLLAAFWLVVLLLARLRIRPAEPPRVAIYPPRFCRPPPRGPPLHAS
ncbi:MAG: hypothetical protein ACSLFJ_11840 [Immundisolibacter sp.]|uniref:hypothetical protein n=1 Tax=Immundisolibacter sp. TaxID=1934948 RepID=UPI003EDEA84B